MKKFVFSRVATYTSYVALFLVTMMSLHTMLALTFTLILGWEGETTFAAEFSDLYHSGMFLLSFIATVGIFIGVALEWDERLKQIRKRSEELMLKDY